MFFLPLTSWMTHIQTPWPRKPRVQLSSNDHWSLLWVSKTNVFLTFEPDLYSNSDSLTPITQGSTKSQPSLVIISEFLNRCSFDPDANRQTNKQTNFFHMTLLTVEGISSSRNRLLVSLVISRNSQTYIFYHFCWKWNNFPIDSSISPLL